MHIKLCMELSLWIAFNQNLGEKNCNCNHLETLALTYKVSVFPFLKLWIIWINRMRLKYNPVINVSHSIIAG